MELESKIQFPGHRFHFGFLRGRGKYRHYEIMSKVPESHISSK